MEFGDTKSTVQTKAPYDIVEIILEEDMWKTLDQISSLAPVAEARSHQILYPVTPQNILMQ